MLIQGRELLGKETCIPAGKTHSRCLMISLIFHSNMGYTVLITWKFGGEKTPRKTHLFLKKSKMSKEKTQLKGHKIIIKKIKLKFKNSSLCTQKSESEVAQLCLTLCDPMDLPGSAVHGIFRARIHSERCE